MPTRTNRTDRAARAVATVAVSLLAATSLAACGGKGSEGSSTTTSVASTGQATTTSKAAGGSSTTASTTSTTASSTTTSAPALPGASTAPHSAPAKGGGVALLRAVRVGRNQGYERIVFEFAGDTVPGYQVAWVEPPITADGSGETVQVAGDAFLQVVMQPASGVDLSGADYTVVYEGPDRIPVAGQTRFIEDLVRTGDFEAVLTWVAGTKAKAPFRVLALSSPTRVVIDIAT